MQMEEVADTNQIIFRKSPLLVAKEVDIEVVETLFKKNIEPTMATMIAVIEQETENRHIENGSKEETEETEETEEKEEDIEMTDHLQGNHIVSTETPMTVTVVTLHQDHGNDRIMMNVNRFMSNETSNVMTESTEAENLFVRDETLSGITVSKIVKIVVIAAKIVAMAEMAEYQNIKQKHLGSEKTMKMILTP
jgi:hypothetical protein